MGTFGMACICSQVHQNRCPHTAYMKVHGPAGLKGHTHDDGAYQMPPRGLSDAGSTPLNKAYLNTGCGDDDIRYTHNTSSHAAAVPPHSDATAHAIDNQTSNLVSNLKIIARPTLCAAVAPAATPPEDRVYRGIPWSSAPLGQDSKSRHTTCSQMASAPWPQHIQSGLI